MEEFGENWEGKSAKINPSLKPSGSPSLRLIFLLDPAELEKGFYTRFEVLCASYIFVFKLFHPQFKISEIFIDEIGRTVEHLSAFRPTVQSICAMWLASAGNAPPRPVDLTTAPCT